MLGLGAETAVFTALFAANSVLTELVEGKYENITRREVFRRMKNGATAGVIYTVGGQLIGGVEHTVRQHFEE